MKSPKLARIVPSMPVIRPSEKLTGPVKVPVASCGLAARRPPKPALLIDWVRSRTSVRSITQSFSSLWKPAMMIAEAGPKYFSKLTSKEVER